MPECYCGNYARCPSCEELICAHGSNLDCGNSAREYPALLCDHCGDFNTFVCEYWELRDGRLIPCEDENCRDPRVNPSVGILRHWAYTDLRHVQAYWNRELKHFKRSHPRSWARESEYWDLKEKCDTIQYTLIAKARGDGDAEAWLAATNISRTSIRF